MQIYTSYFAHRLPDHIVPVSIARWNPKGYDGLSYKPLAPEREVLERYKVDGDVDAYTASFMDMLDRYDVSKVLQDLYKLSMGFDVALMCYEKPQNFCHRHLVAEWLRDYGIDVEEI